MLWLILCVMTDIFLYLAFEISFPSLLMSRITPKECLTLTTRGQTTELNFKLEIMRSMGQIIFR
jgi:hypothetical protein